MDTTKNKINYPDKPATFHPYRAGNMGGQVEILPHWTQMLECSDGRTVFGYGPTKQLAEDEAAAKRKLAENEIAQPAKGQIKIILERCPDRIYDSDQQRLLRLLCEIALEDL